MTKEELEQIYYLNRELKMWEDELSRIRAKSLVQSPVGGSSHGSAVSDRVAQRGERVVELENRIQAKRDEIQDLRTKAVEYITNDIPDSLTRMIVFYRCVSLFGWRRVAYEVGGDNTPDGVRMIYNRFMAKI
ncbi:MAG: hypothetical protein E7478_10515 [Ruminococcaceae bacterium]|nr:hypothetical protein [Oscillospiraceae bacterium]